jgi:truncated hemoglobin YjbI
MQLTDLITPLRDDGGLDHRYTGLAKEIVERAGAKTVSELSEFYSVTSQAEETYGKSALRFVIAAFSVAMDEWQRKAFRKRLRGCLQELGFKPSTSTKLIGAGEYVASQMIFSHNDDIDFCSEEKARDNHQNHINYLREYGNSSLYLLSTMDWKGEVKASNHYHETGKVLSVRELEKLQQRHPKAVDKWFGKRGRPKGSSNSDAKQLPEAHAQDVWEVEVLPTCSQIRAVEDLQTRRQDLLVEEFVLLANSIDWQAVQQDEGLLQMLTKARHELMHAAHLAIPMSVPSYA